MKANHNMEYLILPIIQVSKVLNLKANHNLHHLELSKGVAVLAVSKVLNLGSGGKSL